METQASPEHRPEIQVLEGIRHEIGIAECEQFFSQVPLIAQPALYQIGGSTRYCSWSIVCVVDRIRIQAEFVTQTCANGFKSECQVLGFTIAPGERETHIRATFPAFQ